MLLTHEKFTGFATKLIADKKLTLAALFLLSVDSVDEVNNVLANDQKGGGTKAHEMRDYGFMQQHSVEVLNRHTRDVFDINLSKFPIGQTAECNK